MEFSTAPGFLIAMPQLADPNFARTVVLMLHHSAEGAMGLVVNRRLDLQLSNFCEQHEFDYGGPDDAYLHYGGPCELQRGFMLHQDPLTAEHSIPLASGVYLSTEATSVKSILRRSRAPYVFLLGYAGWGAGQLEREIVEGAWLTSPILAERVFDREVGDLWQRALGDLGVDPAKLAVSTERH